MTEEFTVIAWLFVLLFAYMGIRPVLRLTENGVMKALGPQDDYPEVLNKIGLRAERANITSRKRSPLLWPYCSLFL